jgi:hypothetical protein
MSLNHFVDYPTSFKEELDCYCGSIYAFNALITRDKLTFGGSAENNLSLSTRDIQAQYTKLLIDDYGIEQTLNFAYQRFYQQMVSVSAITQPEYTDLINTSGSIGGKRIVANTTRRGTSFRFEGHGTLSVPSSGKQAKLELYFDTSLIGTTEVFTLPNLDEDTFFDFDMRTVTYALGSQGTIKTFGKVHFIDKQGVTHDVFIDSENNQTYTTTEDAEIELRWTWVTQTAGQLLILHEFSVDKRL